MADTAAKSTDVWLAAGVRTPFAKVDGPLSGVDAIALSVPVATYMIGQLKGGKPDFAVWGNVVPNLTWSNIAREILMDAGADATIPAFSTVGFVFGMQTTVVKPPAAAAREPVSMVSLCVWPGSRK